MLKRTHILNFLIFVLLAICTRMSAVPAKRGGIRYTMSDGSAITVRLFGDEYHHFYTTTDGYMLLRNNAGDFSYAAEKDGRLYDTGVRATEADKRTDGVKTMLRSIDKGECMRIMETAGINLMRKGRKKIAQESKLTTFPTKGSPRLLCILVEFQDTKFSLPDPYKAFHDQLTKEGYDESGATGSIKDYFMASSNGQFVPQFDLYGPVTLPHDMSYYGGNDADGNDLRPTEMVTEACALLDSSIDFSQYDNDGDGVIDNVYIFYAGYGEADGGPASSVWPHSWDVTEAFPDSKYMFDGKTLNHYACSNELRDGMGKVISGIGVFCHEFSHVMGLPDLYSTTYTNAFTPGAWSLMDVGSYNNNSLTPPLHTAYERYCLGWIEPAELKDPCNVTMKAATHIGHYDDAYIIKTSKESEYYILENRQQAGWDAFIPGHGMLVWHINFVPDIWNMNIVNVGKQYVDIVEADNDRSFYSVEGDAFPGTAGVTAFTDDTTPSMITWTGERLHAPITEIKEKDGTVTFMFKGGEDIFSTVTALEATNVKAGGFTARWAKVDKATGYLLSVYRKDSEGNAAYEEGWTMKEVDDVDSFDVTGLSPETSYYYVVRATNGKFYSKPSNEIMVTTLEPTIDFKTVVAKDATEITPTSFTANWERLSDAAYYTLNVYSMQLGEPFTETASFSDNRLPEGWSSDSKTFDSRSAYCTEAPSLRLADGQSLTTKEYKQDVRSLKFWYRGNSSAEENSLIISGNVNGEWAEISNISPIATTSGGSMFETADIPDGCRQIKVSFKRPNSGYVFIDDLTIGYGGNYSETAMPQFDNINVGDVSAFNVTGLTPSETYSYSVIAHNSGLQSKESARIRVTLPSTSALNTIKTNDKGKIIINDRLITVSSDHTIQSSVYTPTGVLIGTNKAAKSVTYNVPQYGIYIVKIGDKAYKILINGK